MEGKSRHCPWHGIHLRHWLETAKRCGVAGMDVLIAEVTNKTPEVIGKVRAKMPADFPELILNRVLDGATNAARDLGDELSSQTTDPRWD